MEITNELVRRIIDSQFPQWRHLAIRSVEKSGHDNRTYRLGNEMTVRLPSHERYASAVEKELTWLPIFKPLLSLPIPVPIAKGEPTDEYPLPWSINRWIDGDTVTPTNFFSTVIAVLMFSLVLGSASAASAKQTTVKAPVILKINQYYVLYTTPDVPYIDKQNRFMMPLRAVSELLGADVGYDAASKKATVSWNEKTVEVTLNSKNVTYNGTSTQIDTVPVLKQGQIFIPARVLIDGLGIQSTYEDSLLTMTDQKFQETSKIISDLKSGIDFYGTPKDVDMNTNDIRPLSLELTTPTSEKDGSIKVKAQNISGKDMPKDTEDLRLTYVYDDGSMGLMSRDRARPAVKAGATYNYSSTISRTPQKSLSYILAVGKTVG